MSDVRFGGCLISGRSWKTGETKLKGREGEEERDRRVEFHLIL